MSIDGVHEAIARLRERCLDGWDWAYVEGSELSEENFKQDLARVLEALESLQKGAAGQKP